MAVKSPSQSRAVRAVFLSVSCFLFKVGEPKPVAKWSTYVKLEEDFFLRSKEGSKSWNLKQLTIAVQVFFSEGNRSEKGFKYYV